MSGTVQYHFEYGFRPLKSGKMGKRYECLAVRRFCPLERCEKCNRIGSPAWVRRWWMRPYEREIDSPEPVLCMGCMNRLRPMWRAARTVEENFRLINRIKREITRVNSTNRR